ncbi:MAG: hypothetical protein FJZ67_00380 [Bacteroidetes bacterium]|nr:hypothetical protein [Bacteroidota bacterium]
MSYTILTIPFNLKEKEEGDFLKKGFVIDDYFKKNSSQSFLKVLEFDNFFIRTSVTKILLKKAGVKEDKLKIDSQINRFFKKDPSFITKTKYFKTTNSYYDFIEPEEVQNEQGISDLDNLTGILVNDLEFYVFRENNNHQKFKIEKINLIFNRQKSNSGIGFGFVTIHIKWIDIENSSQKEFAECIASAAEFLRWYNNEKDSKTKFFNESCEPVKWNKKLQKIQNKVSFELTPFLDNQAESIGKYLYFHDLINQLINDVQNSNDKKELFDFNKNEKIKPFLLHLYQSNNTNVNNGCKDIEDKILTNIYNSLRIPDKDNLALNLESKIAFTPIYPDRYTQLYCLNEGALVVKGNIESKKAPELINDFFPAFLFALNQKYLFHYIQEKINELPLDETSETYKPEALKTLQQTMIYAEFSQIFTSLSNYNEIDMFFEKLRVQFKIEQLKEEFLDSINGISKITQIAEKEKEDTHRKIQKAIYEEEHLRKNQKEKLQGDRLNWIVLLFTVAQVWSGIYDSLPLAREKEGYRFNLIINAIIVLSVLIVVIWYNNQLKKITKQNN